MAKRRFTVEFTGTVTIELDQKVIDVVDDEWRKDLYPLHTPEQIAEHIAYNMVVNHLELNQLDGWADQPKELARLVPTRHCDWDMETREEKPEPKRRKTG